MNRLYVHNNAKMKEEIIRDSHHSLFTVQLRETKMYHDLKHQY